MSSMCNRLRRSRGWKHQFPGHVDQSSQMEEETSSHSASHLHCSLGKGVSTGYSDKGGGLTKGREYPCLITSRTNWSKVIRCHAGRKNNSLPPTGKRPFCAIPSCVSHTRPGISRKVDPSTPSPEIVGIGGSDGIEPPTATGWRPLVGDTLSRGPARPSVATPIIRPVHFGSQTSTLRRNRLSGWRGRRRGSSPSLLRLLGRSGTRCSLS